MYLLHYNLHGMILLIDTCCKKNYLTFSVQVNFENDNNNYFDVCEEEINDAETKEHLKE